MTQTNEKEQATSRGIRRALVVMLLLMLGMVAFFIAYSHLPRAGTGNTVNDLVTPTAAMSHPVGTLTVGRSVDYAGLRMTVPLVEEAGGFSNDQKKSGPYTLRVHLKARNAGQTAVGIDYPSSVRLVLLDGQAVTPQLVAIAPVVLPGATQEGFFDFPLSTQVAITDLSLRFGSGTLLPFGG